MLSLRTFLAALAVLLLAAPAFAVDATDRQSLEKAVPYAISLLEAKNYKTFLETFMPPEELKEATSEMTIDEMARGFARRSKGADMLKALKMIKGMKPTLEEKGTVAIFQLPGDGVKGNKEFKFVRVGKNWYISE